MKTKALGIFSEIVISVSAIICYCKFLWHLDENGVTSELTFKYLVISLLLVIYSNTEKRNK